MARQGDAALLRLTLRETQINGRWPLVLPDHRADFHERRPWWEAARLADMFTRVKPGTTVLDVGSEEGDFTALYASWGAEVAWIDPSRPWLVQTLDTLTANNLPVGSSFVGFAASVDKVDGRIVEEPRFAVLAEEDEIARITLDTFVSLTGFDPEIVCIDTEGSELSVLWGAQGLMKSWCTWYISVHDCDPHASMPSEVHEFMREHGYKDQWLGSLGEHHYRFF